MIAQRCYCPTSGEAGSCVGCWWLRAPTLATSTTPGKTCSTVLWPPGLCWQHCSTRSVLSRPGLRETTAWSASPSEFIKTLGRPGLRETTAWSPSPSEFIKTLSRPGLRETTAWSASPCEFIKMMSTRWCSSHQFLVLTLTYLWFSLFDIFYLFQEKFIIYLLSELLLVLVIVVVVLFVFGTECLAHFQKDAGPRQLLRKNISQQIQSWCYAINIFFYVSLSYHILSYFTDTINIIFFHLIFHHNILILACYGAPVCGRFTLATRRHHCRHCGRLLCGKCSDKLLPIIKFGLNKPVRVCHVCSQLLTLGPAALN